MKQVTGMFFAVFIANLLVTAPQEITFESLQSDFRKRVISLSSEKDLTDTGLLSKLESIAAETFGPHPGLIRQETERRFQHLPSFPIASLSSYAAHQTWEVPTTTEKSADSWMIQRWEPAYIAKMATTAMLTRQLGVAEYGRRNLLTHACPDKVYRLDTTQSLPDLIVDSLGDLFVVKVKMTEVGLLPVSIAWMKQN